MDQYEAVKITPSDTQEIELDLSSDDLDHLAKYVQLLFEIDQANLANKKYDKTGSGNDQQLQ